MSRREERREGFDFFARVERVFVVGIETAGLILGSNVMIKML